MRAAGLTRAHRAGESLLAVRSICFGCRAPHLPLKLGCAKALLEQAGHETLLCDGYRATDGARHVRASRR